MRIQMIVVATIKNTYCFFPCKSLFKMVNDEIWLAMMESPAVFYRVGTQIQKATCNLVSVCTRFMPYFMVFSLRHSPDYGQGRLTQASVVRLFLRLTSMRITRLLVRFPSHPVVLETCAACKCLSQQTHWCKQCWRIRQSLFPFDPILFLRIRSSCDSLSRIS